MVVARAVSDAPRTHTAAPPRREEHARVKRGQPPIAPPLPPAMMMVNYTTNPPTPCLWQGPASTQKTKRKTRPAICRSAWWRVSMGKQENSGKIGHCSSGIERTTSIIVFAFDHVPQSAQSWGLGPPLSQPGGDWGFGNNFRSTLFTWGERRCYLQTNHTKPPPAGFGGLVVRCGDLAL